MVTKHTFRLIYSAINIKFGNFFCMWYIFKCAYGLLYIHGAPFSGKFSVKGFVVPGLSSGSKTVKKTKAVFWWAPEWGQTCSLSTDAEITYLSRVLLKGLWVSLNISAFLQNTK